MRESSMRRICWGIRFLLSLFCLLPIFLPMTVSAADYPLDGNVTITTDDPDCYEVKENDIYIKSSACITISGTKSPYRIEIDGAKNVQITLNNYNCDRGDGWTGAAIGGGQGAASQGTLWIGQGASVSANKISAETTISGGQADVYTKSDMDIQAGETWTIPSGMKIHISPGVKITNYGTIINNGVIVAEGDVTGNDPAVIDCKDAQNAVTGSGTVSGVTVIPICHHVYTDWISKGPGSMQHEKTCTKGCGKVVAEAHSFSDSRCTVCGEKEMPAYVLDGETLTIYKDLTYDIINADWERWIESVEKAKKVVIEEGVTFVEEMAFPDMRGVQELFIPESLSAIDMHSLMFLERTLIYCPERLKSEFESAPS